MFPYKFVEKHSTIQIVDANGDFICDFYKTDKDGLKRAKAIVDKVNHYGEVIEALQRMHDVHNYATGFDNGVTDPTGTMNEGDYMASLAFDQAKAALDKNAQIEKEEKENALPSF